MSEPLRLALTLVPVGLCVGLIGSLIGVGGGFFIVPFLLEFGRAVFGRTFSPAEATAASLGTVLLSALSATASNAPRRRIDYRTGLALAAGTIPTALLGRGIVLSNRVFALSFAVFLLAVAAYIVLVKLRPGRGLVRGTPRELTDSDGQRHAYETNLAWGFGASLLVGLVSSLFGVGGGLLLVPFMVVAYGAPTIVATSTAQFAFAFTALAGLLEALRQGQLTPAGLRAVVWLGVGVVLGAQAGVAAAKRVRESMVRRMIAAVIAAVAARMVLRSFESP